MPATRPPKTVAHAAAPKPKAPPPRVQPRAAVLAGVAPDAAPSWASAPAAPFGLSGPAVVQRKAVVGAADDAYEREADAVAERVVSGPAAAPPRITPVTPGALRPATPREMGEEERRRPPATVQRATRGDRTERGDDARSRSSLPAPAAMREMEEDREDASPSPAVQRKEKGEEDGCSCGSCAACAVQRLAKPGAPVVQRATAGDRTAHDDPEPAAAAASHRKAEREDGCSCGSCGLCVQRMAKAAPPVVQRATAGDRTDRDDDEGAAVQRADDSRRRWGDGGAAMR
ncbi:MAG TPA: hypothetical protein VFR37_23340, partial [Longimicrobium sp.]|nr:hypothetical protein [Longimicrobium sp.]